MSEVLTREAAEAAALLEREAIRAELATKPGEESSKGPKFEPTKPRTKAEADRYAAAKPKPVELAEADRVAAQKRLSWPRINERDYTRLELAQFAAEAAQRDRDAKRREWYRAQRVEAVRGNANFMLADMPAAELAAAAKAKRASKSLAARAALADIAEALDVEVSEVVEELTQAKRLYADREVSVKAAEVTLRGPLTKADREAAAAYRAAAKPRYTFADMASSEAAEAARVALAAIGRTASALVITNPGAARVTVAIARTVPDIKAAQIRVAALTDRLAEARATLAEAEAKAAAAKAAKAVRPLKAAEAEADRVAASVGRLVARLNKAEAAEALALELAAKPQAADLVIWPAASFELAEADRAAELDLPVRPDRAPSGFVERGPSVSWAASTSGAVRTGGPGTGISDPTGDSAAALADGYEAARELAEAREADRAAAIEAAAARAAAEAAKPYAQREEYKERRRLAAKIRRRNAKRRNA